MKKKQINILATALLFLMTFGAYSQKILTKDYVTMDYNSKVTRYHYETVEGDPLNARIYTLENGLKVYMTVYKNEPRIEARIAVRAGSKHDPAETTGLAHYFEHMMFKGTKLFGTTNYEKESVYINQIDSLFEVYRKLTDDKERRALYRVIDSISFLASEYAIANEYDKLMSIIGSTGTNAYVSLEETVYIENIPSNQLENWARIQADRFKNPVLRLFHTELETVYEEKNMILTSDDRKVFFALLRGLFPNHTYGTQTIIGTQEHLKNPSMTNIREFHAKYYIPNNIAICLSGDFDPDKAIKIIDKYFGKMPRSPIPDFTFEPQPSITSPIKIEVWGPDAETIYLGFRFDGANSKEVYMLTLIDMILMNRAAGLFDINLIQQQQVLEAFSYNLIMEDYSVLVLAGRPKTGQTLDQVRDLLLSQIELIKKGEFEDWLLEAIINDLKLQEIKSYESNQTRASAFVRAFILGIPWYDHVNKINKLKNITKEQIVEFVNLNFSSNYVEVHKYTGRDTSIKKMPKNRITPIKINREAESDFLVNIRENKPSDVEPVFLDFQKDITKFSANNIPVWYIENKENETFQLYYVFDMGTQHNKYLSPAVEYLEFIGTTKYSPEEIKKEFYKIGCTFEVFASNDQVYVTLSGLSENMVAGLKLFEHLLADCVPDTEAWNKYVNNILQKRLDAKKNIQYIFTYMIMYGMFGAVNPLTFVLNEKQLKAIDPKEMTDIIKGLTSYKHTIYYYGSHSVDELKKLLAENRKPLPQVLKDYPPKQEFEQKPTDKNKVFFVNFDTPQTQILKISRGEKGFNKNTAAINSLFNDYFGMNMNSIVFQEMRERRGLAYAAISFNQPPSEKDKFYTGISYIATQFDKVKVALNEFNNLLNEMPVSQKLFDNVKDAFIQNLRTERITRADILFAYQRARKLGIEEDKRKIMFENAPKYTLEDLKKYHEKNIKNKTHTILVLGNKKDLSMKILREFGKLRKLKLETIFGY